VSSAARADCRRQRANVPRRCGRLEHWQDSHCRSPIESQRRRR
jgi:hypothetical protein